ncbi:MAG: hypothetical protein LQ350_003953 [Teloschistes chrysophthalmus]|nr:MAG: hypothetical protein LQ350_003953 [Niorma chrysophthalma]
MDGAEKKRKAIDDFFLPTNKRSKSQENDDSTRKCHEITCSKATLFSVRETAVPGLSLYLDFVDHGEERSILAFLNDSSECTWRTDLSRRTLHFGGTYCIMPPKTQDPTPVRPEIPQAPPMPQKLLWLVQRMVEAKIYREDRRPQYCIVNEYTGNLGISAHTENFQFAEPVVGLSLSSACSIRFHELAKPFDGSVRSGKAAKACKTGRVIDVQMPPRSLLVMSGPSRWSWQHEIVRTTKGRGPGWKRVSLTFRYKPEV